MATRRKFNPVISKVKLNPEQAVLTCTCVRGRYQSVANTKRTVTICSAQSVRTTVTQYCTGTASANFT